MSDLSELIKINRNIEKQNTEIIRLLKIIAGEEDDDYVEEEIVQEVFDVFDSALDVGEVFFVDAGDAFKLSVKNNETIIDNLTGDSKTSNFNVAELVANESVKQNKKLDASTVILSESVSGSLPNTLKLCYEQSAKNVYIPWKLLTQLIGAPDNLQTILKLDFYKTENGIACGKSSE